MTSRHDPASLTILHLSDPQFGKNSRFGVATTRGPDSRWQTLQARLRLDLEQLRVQHKLAIDLVVVTGDLAEWGKKNEFTDFEAFLVDLEAKLQQWSPGFSRKQILIIPGNHDINRPLCRAHFLEYEDAHGTPPPPPYWRKWKHFSDFFARFYVDVPEYTFLPARPYTLFELPELGIVAAGMNSTILESHREDEHYGHVGEDQARWFASKLCEHRGTFRLGLVHHNVTPRASRDDENLRDADKLRPILEPVLNMVLHGHTHQGRITWWGRDVPILATGSTAVRADCRAPDVPNQYQIVRIYRNRFERIARQYAGDQDRWIADARVGGSGFAEQKIDFVNVDQTFPALVPRPPSVVLDSVVTSAPRPATSPNTPTPAQEAIRQLREYLLSAYSLDELKSIVNYSASGGDAVYQAIDWQGSAYIVTGRVVTALIRHGAVGDAFFTELIEERPQRAKELQRLKQRWTAHRKQIRDDAERTAEPTPEVDNDPPEDPPQQEQLSPTKPVVPAKESPTPEVIAKTRKSLPGKQLLFSLIDRTKYWKALTHACDTDRRHLGIVVHGTSHQNVEIFVKRIRSYFRGAAKDDHRVWVIGSQSDFSSAVGPADWGSRIRTMLGRLDLTLAETLEDAAKNESPVFLFTSASVHPLHGGDGGLSQKQQDGLVDFFATYLPKHLDGLQAKHPLRFLIPVEYPAYEVEPDDPFFTKICKALKQAPGLSFVPVDPLELPTWHDVWLSIQDVFRLNKIDSPPALGPACRKRFDELIKKHDCTFSALADGLVDVIETVMKGSHDTQS